MDNYDRLNMDKKIVFIKLSFYIFLLLISLDFGILETSPNKQSINKRNLIDDFDKNNENTPSNYQNFLRKINLNYELGFEREFIYRGKWQSTDFYENFQYKEGKIEISQFKISINCSKSMDIDLNCFEVKLSLFDGFSSDKEIELIANFGLKSDNSNSDNFISRDFMNLNYSLTNVFEYPNFSLVIKYLMIKRIEIKFENFELNNINIRRSGLQYNFQSVIGKINLENANLEFNASIVDYYGEHDMKIHNFCLLMTVLGLYQLYQIFCVFFQLLNNSNLAKNTSLISIIHSVLVNFYIALKMLSAYIYDSKSTDKSQSPFLVPTIIYFFAFSLVESRILMIVWQSRYPNLEPLELKKKFYSFITYLYITLACLTFSSDWILSKFFLILVFYICAWTPQIVLNFQTGQMNLNLKFIWSMSISIIFLPIYFRMYTENFLSISSAYFKSLFLIFVLLIQFFLLYIQANFGSRSIVPKYFKNPPYNFYVDLNDENLEDCVICLESLKKIYVLESNIHDDFFEKKKKGLIDILKIKIADIFFYKNMRKDHMKTPCNHYFHSDCLELWLKNKFECPFCRTQVPPLE